MAKAARLPALNAFETPEQALYREQIETMRAQQPQQAALQQQYLTLAQQQAEYQQRQQPIQERLQQQYLTLAEQQAAAQERQQPGQERLQALYMDIAEQQAKSQQLEAAWQQETAPQRRAQIENELRIQQQTLTYQETALRQYQEQQKMQPLLYEQAGVKPIYDEAGNITSFGLTEEGQKRQDYESQLLDRQRKALAGELPVDPTLERTLQEGETQLRAQLQAQLGTGYETSTPGIQALAEFSRRAAEARSNVAHGQLVSGQNLLANEQELLQRRQAGATSGRGMLGEYGLRPVSFGQGVQAGGQPNYLGLASNAAPGHEPVQHAGTVCGWFARRPARLAIRRPSRRPTARSGSLATWRSNTGRWCRVGGIWSPSSLASARMPIMRISRGRRSRAPCGGRLAQPSGRWQAAWSARSRVRVARRSGRPRAARSGALPGSRVAAGCIRRHRMPGWEDEPLGAFGSGANVPTGEWFPVNTETGQWGTPTPTLASDAGVNWAGIPDLIPTRTMAPSPMMGGVGGAPDQAPLAIGQVAGTMAPPMTTPCARCSACSVSTRWGH